MVVTDAKPKRAAKAKAEPVIEIKSRWGGTVIFTAKGATTVAAALAMAIAAGADLARANLTGAYLTGANLARANLTGADLTGAYLREANLARANLREANLTGANLREANLTGAYLTGANLTGANLREANLTGANLTGANLTGADLAGADLTGAYLREANLREANLAGAKGLAYQIPQEGELIVWKAVTGGVCKLRIPPEAKRTASMIGRKCRAEWVEVLEAPKNGRGLHDSSVIYRAGEVVRPNKYDPDPREECTHGIHFFQTREEAEAYR